MFRKVLHSVASYIAQHTDPYYDGARSGVSNPAGWLTQLLGSGGLTREGRMVSLTEALSYPPFWAAVRMLSDDVSKLPLHVWRRYPDGRRVRDDQHHLARSLRRPNDWQSCLELVRTWMVSLCTYGNAYSVLVPTRGRAPTRMVPIPPGMITLQETSDGERWWQISPNTEFLKAQLGKWELDIPAEYVLHLRNASIEGIIGWAPMVFAAPSVGFGVAAERHGSALFSRGARPGGVIELEKRLSADNAQRLKEAFDLAYNAGQATGAGSTAILHSGAKWNAMTLGSTDAQYLENRRFQVNEVARIFRIDPSLLGESESSKYSNKSEARLDYAQLTLTSWIELLESALDFHFQLFEEQRYVEFNIGRIFRADPKTRYEQYAIARQWGLLNANEIRELEGQSPYTGGDTFLHPLNMAAVDGASGRVSAVQPNIENSLIDSTQADSAQNLIARHFQDSDLQEIDPNDFAGSMAKFLARNRAPRS